MDLIVLWMNMNALVQNIYLKSSNSTSYMDLFLCWTDFIYDKISCFLRGKFNIAPAIFFWLMLLSTYTQYGL